MRQCNCYSPRREVYERIQQMIDATWGELTVVASVIAGLWGMFFWLSR